MQKCIKTIDTNTKKYCYIENKSSIKLRYIKEIRKWKRRLEVFMKLNLMK